MTDFSDDDESILKKEETTQTVSPKSSKVDDLDLIPKSDIKELV